MLPYHPKKFWLGQKHETAVNYFSTNKKKTWSLLEEKNVAPMQQNSGAHCNGTKDNYKSLSLLGCAKYDEIDIGYSKVLVSRWIQKRWDINNYRPKRLPAAACSLKTYNTQMNKNVNTFSELILLHFDCSCTFYCHVGLVWYRGATTYFFRWDKNYVVAIIAPLIF